MNSPAKRDLLLIFVAYHPSVKEVNTILSCLKSLPSNIGYAVVVNGYQSGEPVDLLSADADYFMTNSTNLGYGRAINSLVEYIEDLPQYIGILNTDIFWQVGTFSSIVSWLNIHPEVALAVPSIYSPEGDRQHLCKQNPTLLALFSRRFIPDRFKPNFLKRYDSWYLMSDHDYNEIISSTYLSGCCMIVRSEDFNAVGGFDDRYFLYLEDADLTRTLADRGMCVHLPNVSIVHGWGRGNYSDMRLTFVNLISVWKYFTKWGWVLW